MVLSIAYFPPVQWFAALARDFDPRQGLFSVVYLEAHEHFQKQSYRNRCRFYSDKGPQNLNFPIVHESGTHELPITSIKVDYSTQWVRVTENAIASAYYSSPYFEYYKDELFAILDSHPETLWELDMRIIRFFLDKLGIKVELRLTDEYYPASEQPYGEDLREVIHPKRPDTILKDMGLEKEYWQVFSDRYGFIPGLSIMDLLFNEGPESILYVLRSLSDI